MFEQIDTKELKLKFAEGLLRAPENPFAVAAELTENTSLALRMSQLWVKDPIVVEEKERLLSENGARSFLPTKEDLAREVIDEARKCNDPDLKIKAFKLYGDVMGYIEKPTTNVTANVQNVTNRVMLVPASTSNDKWRDDAVTQQERLINESRATTEH